MLSNREKMYEYKVKGKGIDEVTKHATAVLEWKKQMISKKQKKKAVSSDDEDDGVRHSAKKTKKTGNLSLH